MTQEDPVWHGLEEDDEPGYLLQTIAIGFVATVEIYRLPDRLWRLIADLICR